MTSEDLVVFWRVRPLERAAREPMKEPPKADTEPTRKARAKAIEDCILFVSVP